MLPTEGMCLSTPEIVAVVKDVLLGIAAATTATVAVIGLKSWRRALNTPLKKGGMHGGGLKPAPQNPNNSIVCGAGFSPRKSFSTGC